MQWLLIKITAFLRIVKPLMDKYSIPSPNYSLNTGPHRNNNPPQLLKPNPGSNLPPVVLLILIHCSEQSLFVTSYNVYSIDVTVLFSITLCHILVGRSSSVPFSDAFPSPTLPGLPAIKCISLRCRLHGQVDLFCSVNNL